MKFAAVEVFSSGDYPVNAPLVFYRNPENLYIWFSLETAWILTQWGWTLWPRGWSIAEVLASE
jgi:hypothetical protein